MINEKCLTSDICILISSTETVEGGIFSAAEYKKKWDVKLLAKIVFNL